MIGWLRRNTLCRLGWHREHVDGPVTPSGLRMTRATCSACGIETRERVNTELYRPDYATGFRYLGPPGRRRALILRAAGLA